MDEDLLRYLLAAFPGDAPTARPDDEDYLVIRGYRVPYEVDVD